MRNLELGAERFTHPGFESLDADPRGGGTFINFEKLERWPMDDNTYDNILTIHMIEHIYPSCLPFIFSEVHRILKPGGSFRVHVPNGPVIAQTYMELPERRESLMICFYGLEGEFDRHKALYDYTALANVFTSRGFVNVSNQTNNLEYRDRHDEGWEPLFRDRGWMSLKVVGYKPA